MRHTIARYHHFGECLCITNGVVELVIPRGFGIRVLRYAQVHGPNVFFEQPADMTALTTDRGWRIYGGHRLWVSPESPDAYYPDNAPVEIEVAGETVCIRQAVDPWLGIEKELCLTLAGGADVLALHRVTNRATQPQTLALWAISALAPGGRETIGLPETAGHWGPWQHLTAWEYTNLGDSRARYEKRRITLTQGPGEAHYKIGLSDTLGCYHYHLGATVFEKRAEKMPGRTYPDGGMCFETFVCDPMLEMETLSPLHPLAPGEAAEHQEIWSIAANAPQREDDV